MFWLEKLTNILGHPILYSAQTSTLSVFPALSMPTPRPYFLTFWGYTNSLAASLQLQFYDNWTMTSMETDWY